MNSRGLMGIGVLVVLSSITALLAYTITVRDSASISAQEADARNVLIIIADDLGVEMLGSYGVGANPANTPNLDALAAEGVLFEQAWAYPLCTPFRAASLTGRFGFRTGVGTVGGGVSLPMGETIIPEVLSAHPELGVSHAAIGKWHLGGGPMGATNHGFSHFAGTVGELSDYFAWQRVIGGRTAAETGYATSVQADDAITWIESQGEKPWFMWLAFNAPHDPFHRPPADLHTVSLPAGDIPERGAGLMPFYQAAIESMDTEIGRVLETMDPAVLARTTIIFMGDNGTPAAVVGAPFARLTSKGSVYQGGIWTPMIVSGAGIKSPGRRVEHLVHSVDLSATSLDLLGLLAEDMPSNIDGQSLRPYLESPEHPAIRDWAFSEQFGSPRTPEKDGKAIRDLRYKYIRFDSGIEAFYDLETDPYEAREIIAAGPSADESAALDDLRARLDALLAGPPATAGPVATVDTPTPEITDTPTLTPEAAATAIVTSTVVATATPITSLPGIFIPLAMRNGVPEVPVVAPATPMPSATSPPSSTEDPTPTAPPPTEAPSPTAPSPTEPPAATPAPDACPESNFLDVKPHPENSEYPDPELRVSCEDDLMIVESNGIPSFEYLQVTRFPLVAKDHRWEIPLEPVLLDEPEDLPLLGPVGIVIDGLPIYGPNEADTLGFGDPFLDELLDFCNGHTGLAGGYHHHAIAACHWEEIDGRTELVVGYAFDGFPIMAPFSCVDAECTEVEKLESSWQRTSDVRAAWEAHEFVEGSGDLDRCNGLLGEGGRYRYFATDTFPYLLGCFAGEPRDNVVRGGGGRPPLEQW